MAEREGGWGAREGGLPTHFRLNSAQLSVTVAIGSLICRYGMASPRARKFSTFFSQETQRSAVWEGIGGEGMLGAHTVVHSRWGLQ